MIKKQKLREESSSTSEALPIPEKCDTTKMNRREAGLAVMALAAGFAARPLLGQAGAGEAKRAGDAGNAADPERAPIITHGTGTFNGKKVAYTATVEGIDVPDAKGKLSARVVSFAYTADGVSDAATRPVIFAFNGGPIVASLWLHIGILGPKRVEVPEDLAADPASYRLVDNKYSPLDVADIVCIDPASTGYSRVLAGTRPESYFSVAADTQQVTAFIAAWLTKHNRLSSPVCVLGESYGTIRAAVVAGLLTALPQPILPERVILLGQAVNIIEYSQRPQNIVSYAVSLPTLAALAWYHNRIDRKGRTVEEFADEAWRFGQTDYLTALFQGNAIDTAERDRVAKRLEELSGIPAAYYREHNLRITKEQFRGELLKDRGLLLGRDDGRYVAPMTAKGLAADPSDIIMTAYSRLFNDYLRQDLNVHWPEEYMTIAKIGGMNDWGWDYGSGSPFSSWAYSDGLLKAMRENPRFRVLVCEGYYDTETTPGSATYLVRDAGWPADRASTAFFEGGHAAYMAEPAGEKFADAVRGFIERA